MDELAREYISKKVKECLDKQAEHLEKEVITYLKVGYSIGDLEIVDNDCKMTVIPKSW